MYYKLQIIYAFSQNKKIWWYPSCTRTGLLVGFV